MQKLSALKTIADIIFFILLIPAVFGIPFIIMYYIMPDKIPFTIDITSENILKSTESERGLFFFLAYICFIIDVYALYLFREALGLFKKKIFFDYKIAGIFARIGKLIITSYLIYYIGYFVLSIITVQELSLNIDLSILIAFGIGYFFIVLGSIFKMACKIKEENELTV